LAITLAGFTASLERHMPASAQRDFQLWAISAENPRQDMFLQAMGITQLVKLTVTLLDGLVDDAQWGRLASYSAAMNAYLTYEAVSDNLAIGVAGARRGDKTLELRTTLLHDFNQAMLARLNGDPRPAAQLLAPLQAAARRISAFDQSLSRDKHQLCAEAYLILHNQLALSDLEHQVWPALVANIEACVEMAQSMRANRSGELLRAGLISRYRAVNQLLDGQDMPLSRRVDVGADAILVAPTLAYYIAALAEVVQPLECLSCVIADNSLAAALHDAAVLVRLLNDLGTRLVTFAPGERAALLRALLAHYEERPERASSIVDLLSGFGNGNETLTRLHKDIAFGEFNVALHGLGHITCMREALQVFENNLAYFAQQYAAHQRSLQTTLVVISQRLADDRVSALIDRFVRFHEQLYENAYYQSAGEYAI
jgi:hypothetical protein